jgi:hypothetical protein
LKKKEKKRLTARLQAEFMVVCAVVLPPAMTVETRPNKAAMFTFIVTSKLAEKCIRF